MSDLEHDLERINADWRVIAEHFGRANWPDTKLGNAASDLHQRIDRVVAAARSSAALNDLKIKAEAMNLVLSVVSARANVDTPTLVSMLREAEEELRAKRWLS